MISTQKQTSNISIVVPTLNEAKNLPRLKPAAEQVHELIVVDGGSTDQTIDIAQELGFTVIQETGSEGRGKQLNTGARTSTSQIILFLHADTLLPPDFPDVVLSCLQKKTTVLGAFSLKVNKAGILLNFIVMCANLRSRFLNLPYGDQALFMRRTDFIEIGGFQEVPIMEDFMLVKKAGRHGKIQTLPQSVTTSARRWQQLGTLRTTVTNQLIILGYYLGISPQKLASVYRKR